YGEGVAAQCRAGDEDAVVERIGRRADRVEEVPARRRVEERRQTEAQAGDVVAVENRVGVDRALGIVEEQAIEAAGARIDAQGAVDGVKVPRRAGNGVGRDRDDVVARVTLDLR